MYRNIHGNISLLLKWKTEALVKPTVLPNQKKLLGGDVDNVYTTKVVPRKLLHSNIIYYLYLMIIISQKYETCMGGQKLLSYCR